MCRPASMVVVMGPKAFSSRKTDKHIEIRKEFGLPENGVGRVTSVQVELVPDENDFSRPLPEWRFVVDQDELPEWWDAEAAEKECRHELEKWASVRLIRDGDVRSIDDGDNIVAMLGGTLTEMRGGTLTEMRGGTLTEMWGGTLTAMRGGTLNAMRGGTVCFYRAFSVNLKGPKTVVIDRTGDKAICHVGTEKERVVASKEVAQP